MEHLGAPFVWSIVAVLGIAVAAAMIGYGIYAIRKKDEPDPLYDGISGTLKEDWARTGNIDFHVAALESTSPQQFIAPFFIGEITRITQTRARSLLYGNREISIAVPASRGRDVVGKPGGRSRR
jgi:hypothetical protein